MKTIINSHTPFNFKHSLDYFSRSEKEIVDLCKEGIYQRVLDIEGKPKLVMVRAVGPVYKPALEINLPGCRSNRQLEEVVKIVKQIFSLERDIRPYYHEISGDEVLSRLSSDQYGFKPPVTPTLFEALVWAITGQQLNLSFIYSLKARMVMRYGSKCHYNTRRYYGFPSPQELSQAKGNELRGMQFSRRKAEYITGLARNIVKGKIDLSEIEGMEDEEALERLMKIRGVGRWTAEYALIRGLGRWGVIPADDIGVRNAVTHFYKYKKQVDAREVRKRAVEWGKYKGCAAFYLLFAYQRYKQRKANRSK
jgi:DNA-3-methyladenine glycosylase II